LLDAFSRRRRRRRRRWKREKTSFHRVE